jgi:diacylglycerol O-acyltransferase
VNLVVTNAPGPSVPLYLVGARLLEVFPMMPTMGNLTLVVGALSYEEQLNITAVADRDGCPDLEVFTRGVRTALDDLAREEGGMGATSTTKTSVAHCGSEPCSAALDRLRPSAAGGR